MNKGLFHPILNVMGTKKASDDKYWYDTTQSFTSVADCFNTSKLLTASGYIASGKSGRPDGIYYDVLYAENMIECREYAKVLTHYEVDLIRTDKEENGVDETFELLGKSGTVTVNGSWVDESGLNRVKVNVNNITTTNYGPDYFAIASVNKNIHSYFIIVGNNGSVAYVNNAQNNSETNMNISTANNGNTAYIGYAKLATGFPYGTKSTTDFNTLFPVGTILSFYAVKPTTRPILSSNTKLSTDLIGNPTNYPQIMKDRLASGVGIIGLNPLLVDGLGNNLIPDGTSKNYKVSNKSITPFNGIYSTDNGLTYVVDPGMVSEFNYISNARLSWPPATGFLMFINYTSKNNPYIQTTPKAVIDVEPKVKASSSHSIYKGALIGNQVAGKVQVGNGVNGYESKVLENTHLAQGNVEIILNKEITITTGQSYLCGTGFTGASAGKVATRIGSTLVFTYTTASDDVFGTTANWKIESNVNANHISTTPSHSTIALDNVNSPASKWFECLEEGNNGVLAGVYGKELAYNLGTTSFDGDNELFDQLTNGTKTDLNGRTIRTFHGSLPINGRIK